MPRRKNDDRHWFLCDTTHGRYAAFLALAETRHKSEWPDNELSVVLNDAGTQSLVKVSAADAAFRAAVEAGIVLTTYDRRTHGDALTLLAAPAWSNTRADTV